MAINEKVLNPRQEIWATFGDICKQPSLLINDNVHLDLDDFVLPIQKIIFGSISNIINQQGSQKSISAIDIDTYLHSFEKQNAIWKRYNGINVIQEAIDTANPDLFRRYYMIIKKMSLLRLYNNSGYDLSGIYNVATDDPAELEKQQKNLDKMSLEDITTYFDNKNYAIKKKILDWGAGNKSFKAGDNLEDYISNLNDNPQYGLGFKDGYLNTLTGGMQLGKLFLRSMASGHGKTRLAMMDMLSVALTEKYHPRYNKWIKNSGSQPALFISTELEEDEINSILLSALTKIPSHIIKRGHFDNKTKLLLKKAQQVLHDSPLYFVELPEFSISDVIDTINNYIVNYGVKYIAFDYIQMNPKLSRTGAKDFGGRDIRDDQILLELASRLKQLATNKQVFIMTATQLGGSRNEENYYASRTESALRGSKAIADKIDIGIIASVVNKKDKSNLEKYVQDPSINPDKLEPNMGIFMYKNRLGDKMKAIWAYVSLDTLSYRPLFVTDYDYQIQKMSKTHIVVDGNDNYTVKERIAF